MISMDDHELLIRHAIAWAEHRRQTLDRDLLQTTLDLRGFHDDRSPQEWPIGSVEHLMLVRWPSHGPSEEPDVDALVRTLDSFWRFLRGTGRMASVSADPKALTKEARRAASGMREACADPSRHGMSKSLLEFGREIGVSLEEAGSEEEMNERLQIIMDQWNALPEDERRAKSPSVSAHHGSLPGQSASALMAPSVAEDGFDLPVDEHGNVPFADLGEVAAQVRASAYVQQCRRLVTWVGTGRPVTPNQVLRLAPAREVYAELDLWDWERVQQGLWLGEAANSDPRIEEDELRRKGAMQAFRSSADCWPLDRMWLTCHEFGLIEIGKTKATGVWVEPTTDEQWRQLGVSLIGSLLVHMSPSSRRAVTGALLRLLGPDRHTGVGLHELEEWWWGRDDNLFRSLEDHGSGSFRGDSDNWLRAGLHEMSDTGVWRREGEVLHATALGYDIALVATYLMEVGSMEE